MEVSVLEDAPVGFSVFQVVDGDVGNNAKITYSLSDTSVFQIHPDSGDVTVTAELDRETVAGYTVSVTATDHGHPAKSDTTDLEIVIADVNDNAPKFSSSAYSAKVYEDAFVTEKVLVLEATDADAGNNGRVRYTFEGGDLGGGDFMVNPISGELRIARSLDHEHTASYSLVAYAVDRGSPERSTAVSINIQPHTAPALLKEGQGDPRLPHVWGLPAAPWGDSSFSEQKASPPQQHPLYSSVRCSPVVFPTLEPMIPLSPTASHSSSLDASFTSSFSENNASATESGSKSMEDSIVHEAG